MKSDRGFFCFPEVNLGIPFRPGMNAFIKKAVPLYKLSEMQLTGNRYTAQELEAHHIILKACNDKEDLMAKALAYAKTFQKKRGIFGELKKRLYKDIIEIMDTPVPHKSDEIASLAMSD
jgi:enoyl-CoA hydratase/carnithine racemase